MVPVADSQKLASAILRLIKDEELRTNLAMEAKKNGHGIFPVREQSPVMKNFCEFVIAPLINPPVENCQGKILA